MGLVAGRRAKLTVIRAGLLALLLAIGTASGASARVSTQRTAASGSTSCAQPTLRQPFLSTGDFNYYAAAPGLAGTGYAGSHWLFSGGAKVVTSQRANGTLGHVLDLPGGSVAMSPDICVMSGQNPLARAFVQSMVGKGSLQVSVSYLSSGGPSRPLGVGGVKLPATGWALSNPINIPPPPPPGANSGWHVVRFTFTAPRGSEAFQMYRLSLAALPPTPSTAACSNPALSQPFLSAGDRNYYTPAPGQSAQGFVGTGWTLTGGAKIVTVTRPNGSRGLALDLPAGSMAVSPNVCVTSLYPTARMMVRSVFGGDDVSFRVSYARTNSWTNPDETGHVQGNSQSWTLSGPVNLQPNNVPGWQIVRLTLVPDGSHSEFQIYNLELDPYARG